MILAALPPNSKVNFFISASHFCFLNPFTNACTPVKATLLMSL